MSAGGHKRLVTYDGIAYKVRSGKAEIPDLAAMDRMAALIWLNQNTYARGTNHRRPAPNIAGINLEVR
jgi:hypothetical protein